MKSDASNSSYFYSLPRLIEPIHKKLSPFVGFYQQTLDKFLGEFWDYYRELVAYRDSPNPDTKQELKSKFWKLFGTETGYKQKVWLVWASK
jgi:hypothetical protein